MTVNDVTVGHRLDIRDENLIVTLRIKLPNLAPDRDYHEIVFSHESVFCPRELGGEDARHLGFSITSISFAVDD